MEKFMDHTDIGMTQPSTCKSANPTAIPAKREDQRQAGGEQHAERDEQQDHGGQAAHQLGLVQCFGVDLVEVAPHRPLAGHLRLRAGRECQFADVGAELAGRDRTAGVVLHDLVDGNQRGVAVTRDESGGSREARAGSARRARAARAATARRAG